MNTLIMKFGSSVIRDKHSVASVANIVRKRNKEFQRIIVVVEALESIAKQFFSISKELHLTAPINDVKTITSASEDIAATLLSMTLKAKGKKAAAITQGESGVITSAKSLNSRIIDIRPNKLVRLLREMGIVVVSGSQGRDLSGNLTNLGEGGAGTTAVAIASAFSSKKVEIYESIPGNLVEIRKWLSKNEGKVIPYEVALKLSSSASFLNARSIELAQKRGISLHLYPFKQTRRKEGSDKMCVAGSKSDVFKDYENLRSTFSSKSEVLV